LVPEQRTAADLSEQEVIDIRWMVESGRMQIEDIARKFKIKPATAKSIASRRSRKEVE
jgi:DNA-binding CsgD family transcriptional regulator